ncbi:MAG: glutathione peroxidase [Bacteroidales bacterium]|nr:glutathione peroxidase [Bacteroidales bacterium]
MKKHLIILIALFIGLASYSQKRSLYDFKVKTLEGEAFDFSSLKGKKVLVVNVASKCGLTPQYEDLQKLYNQYKDQGLVIVGFPANNFLKQEPGSHKDIRQFCTENYGVTFPIMEKISVKGKNIHPIYQFLTQKDQNGVMDSKVKWNFQKFMIDESGNLVDVVWPREKPFDEKIINWLNN